MESVNFFISKQRKAAGASCGVLLYVLWRKGIPTDCAGEKETIPLWLGQSGKWFKFRTIDEAVQTNPSE